MEKFRVNSPSHGVYTRQPTTEPKMAATSGDGTSSGTAVHFLRRGDPTPATDTVTNKRNIPFIQRTKRFSTGDAFSRSVDETIVCMRSISVGICNYLLYNCWMLCFSVDFGIAELCKRD